LHEGTIIAAVLGYLDKRRCFLHSAGVQRSKVKSLAPGITLYAQLIRKLIETNVKVLDLSPGIEEYKLRLGGETQSIIQVVIFKNKISEIFYKSNLFIFSAMKRIRARVW
jgi:CelD/BcsL family acetyltransferase involved in cellulose biosynthesis